MYVNVPWTDTQVTVNNTLTSTSLTEALSANQGKELKTLVDGVTGSSSVEISDAVPTSPSAGDLWIDSASMSLNAYYADGTSSQWVGISGSGGGGSGGSGGFNGAMDAHMIPDANNTYDIGSAEYKIRDLYVSDNSLWIGDDHKVSIEGGKQKNKKRKKGKTPKKVFDALIGDAPKPFPTEADLKAKFKIDIHDPAPDPTVDPEHVDFQPLTHQWLHFAIINGMVGAITPENIFDDTDDFEEDSNYVSISSPAFNARLDGNGNDYYNFHPRVNNLYPTTGSVHSLDFVYPQYRLIFSGDATLTYTASIFGSTMMLMLQPNGHTVTWSGSAFKWAGGTEPTWSEHTWWLIGLTYVDSGYVFCSPTGAT
jgi:hypothetical protein